MMMFEISIVGTMKLDLDMTPFLADRCNCIAKFGYCHVSSVVVVCLYVYSEKKRLRLGSRGFH